jgi:hypothetical protein
MDEYDLFVIGSPYKGNRIWYRSTDPESAQWLLNRFRESFPALRVMETYTFPSGDIYGYGLNTKAKVNEFEIRWWAAAQLCHHSWEPMLYDYHSDDPRAICFRRKRERMPNIDRDSGAIPG